MVNLAGGSTPAAIVAQILTPNGHDYWVPPHGYVGLLYDPGVQRWTVLGQSFGGPSA